MTGRGACGLACLVGDTAELLDVPLHLTLTDTKFKAAHLGEEEEDIGIELMAVLEGAPANLLEPVCKSDGSI